MLSSIVGNVDSNAALVLVAFFAMITIVGGILVAKRRSRLEINNDFELAKIRQADAHEETIFAKETERGFKMGQLEQNLLTSHSRVHDGGDSE